MSRLMELPDPVFSALEKAAQAQGTTPVGWIASQLAKAEVSPQKEAGHTLADRFAGRLGRIRSGGQKALSESCGQQFTDYLRQKKQAGQV